MGSTENPEKRWQSIASVSQLLSDFGPWLLFLAGIMLGVIASQERQPAATPAVHSTDSERAHKPERFTVGSSLRSLSLSADEQYLDVMQTDTTWRRHDAHTGCELWRRKVCDQPLKKHKIRSRDLVTAGTDHHGRLVIMEDAQVHWNGTLPHQQPEETVQCCAICLEGNRIAAVSDYGSLWVVELGELQPAVTTHHVLKAVLDGVKWSPSGDRLAIMTASRDLLIWDVAQSQLSGKLSAAEVCCRVADWSSDGRRIITYGHENFVRVWQANTLTLLHDLHLTSHFVLAAVLSQDGRRAAVGDGELVSIWDLEENSNGKELSGHEAPVTQLCFDRTGETLISIDSDDRIIRWAVTDHREIWSTPLSIKGN